MHRVLLTFLFCSLIFGQISQSDLRNISNEQLDLIREELNKAQVSIPAQGQSVTQVETNTDEVSINTEIVSSVTSPYFGYNYFQRNLNFYDNIPAPDDYRLGPGDQVIISFWGEKNSQEVFTIDKKGQIFYADIGFLNISNKTLQSAEEYLNEEFSKIFATLSDTNNATKINLSLGELKSINVFFTGQIANPGLQLIHPFSDVFTAIVQAGGVNIEGSLRNVQVIRKNKIIKSLDFYSFFLEGKNEFSRVRLLDGDIIHIPNIENRASIQGSINNGGFFEFLEGESISNLLDYAGGLSVSASSSAILNSIVSIDKRLSDDNARISKKISMNEFSSTILINGDSIDILPISGVQNTVEVLGRVKRPGNYPAYTNLKEVLDIVGGFEDPEFVKSINLDEIIVIRKDENQFYGSEFKTSYKASTKFNLMPGDKILVYENINFENTYTVSINGEVNKPGVYPFKDGMTVRSLVSLADGMTPLSSESHIIVYENFSRPDNSADNLNNTRGIVSNASMDFELSPGTTIFAFPAEKTILVQGNVFNPGLITPKSKSISISQAASLAGGYKKNSDKKRIYITRANGTTERGGRFDRVYPGDTLNIPLKDKERDFDITAFTADIATTLANIAAILIIVDNNN